MYNAIPHKRGTLNTRNDQDLLRVAAVKNVCKRVVSEFILSLWHIFIVKPRVQQNLVTISSL